MPQLAETIRKSTVTKTQQEKSINVATSVPDVQTKPCGTIFGARIFKRFSSVDLQMAALWETIANPPSCFFIHIYCSCIVSLVYL
jgi:hypothetical protein